MNVRTLFNIDQNCEKIKTEFNNKLFEKIDN